MSEPATPTIPEIADAVAAVVTESPQPARDLVPEINRRLKTKYDARGIARGLSKAVQDGRVVRGGSSSRPLYSKASA
jgi:hypothetical protein